jgi:hypothetical protein
VSCPFHAVTGLWCPGCGMTRATYEIVTGHPMSALGTNLLWPVVAVVFGWIGVAWLWPRVKPPSRAPAALWIGLVVVSLVYSVLRNVPTFSALAP